MAHNYVTGAHIRTKLGTQTKNNVLVTVLLSECTFVKIQEDGSCHSEFLFNNHHNSSAQNLKQRLRQAVRKDDN